jgi:hypothetical protein
MFRLISGLTLSMFGFMFMLACLPVYRFDDITFVLNMHHLTGEPRVLLWVICEVVGLFTIAFGLATAKFIPWK